MKLDILRVFSGELISKMSILLVNLILIGVLNVEEYSKYIFLFSMSALGAQLSCASIERLYISDYDNFKWHAYKILNGSVFLFFCILLFLKINEISINSLLITGGVLWATATLQFERVKLQKEEKFSLYSLVDIIKNSCWSVLVLLLVLFFPNEISANVTLAILLFSAGLAYFFSRLLIVVKKTDNKICNINFVDSIRKNIDVYAYTLIAALFPYVPIIMTSWEGDDHLVATYGAAMRYQAVIGMCAYVFNVVFLPRISNKRNIKEMVVIRNDAKKNIVIISLLLVVVVAVIFFVMPFVDSGKYPNSPIVFLFLAASSILSLISSASISFLLTLHKYRSILIAMFIGLSVSVLSCFFLNRFFPIVGVAIASLMGYVIVAGMIFLSANKNIRSIEN